MFNQITIMGHVGRDPELRYLPSGDAVVNLSVATSERWKDKDGNDQEKTQWHRVKAFGRLAEVMGEYLKQGSQVFIQGAMEYGSYEKDGVTHYTADIKASTMKLLGRKQDSGSGGGGRQEDHGRAPAPNQRQTRAPAPAPKSQGGFDDMDDDSIPF